MHRVAAHILIVVGCALSPIAMAAEPPDPKPSGSEKFRETLRSDLHRFAAPRSVLLLAAGAAASAAVLHFEDPRREAAIFDRGAFDGTSDFGNEYGSGLTLVALSSLFLGVGHLADDSGMKRTGGEMLRSLAYTGLAVTALKVAFHRTRPNGGAFSFPSGHTAAAFAVAPVLAGRLGFSAAIPAYALAAATAIGRMEDRKHYLSDVLFGASVGLSIGLAVSGEEPLPANLRLQPGVSGAALTYSF